MDSSVLDDSAEKCELENIDSVEKEEKIAKGLRKFVTSERKNKLAKIVSKEQDIGTSDDLINGVNDKVLLDVLSPEVNENEKTKRRQKWCLLGCLIVFLISQFFAVYHFTQKIIGYSVCGEAEIGIVDLLLKFDVAYITSVIIELIAILRYIVRSVFDASITELIKIFKNNSDEDKKSDNKKKLK